MSKYKGKKGYMLYKGRWHNEQKLIAQIPRRNKALAELFYKKGREDYRKGVGSQFEARWERYEHPRKILVEPPTEPVYFEFEDPQVYVQGRWESSKKVTDLVEIKLKLSGRFKDHDAVQHKAYDTLEDILGQSVTGSLEDVSPGFVAQGITIDVPATQQVHYHYSPTNGTHGLGCNTAR